MVMNPNLFNENKMIKTRVPTKIPSNHICLELPFINIKWFLISAKTYATNKAVVTTVSQSESGFII